MVLFGIIGSRGRNWIKYNIIIVVVFAFLYYIADTLTLKNKNIENYFGKTSEKSIIDYLYFSLLVQTTVGGTAYEQKQIEAVDFHYNKLSKYLCLLQLMSLLYVTALAM